MTDPGPTECGDELLLDVNVSERTRTIAVQGFHALWRAEPVHVFTLDPDGADAHALARQGRLELDPDGCNQDHLAASLPTDLVGQPITITEAAHIGRSAWSDIAPST